MPLFAARAEEFRGASAGAGVELAGAFDQSGAVEQATEILLVQFKPGNGFDDAL